jgi:hypothetical protein
MSVVNVLSEWLISEAERLNKSYAVLRKQFDNKNKALVNRWKAFLRTQPKSKPFQVINQLYANYEPRTPAVADELVADLDKNPRTQLNVSFSGAVPMGVPKGKKKSALQIYKAAQNAPSSSGTDLKWVWGATPSASASEGLVGIRPEQLDESNELDYKIRRLEEVYPELPGLYSIKDPKAQSNAISNWLNRTNANYDFLAVDMLYDIYSDYEDLRKKKLPGSPRGSGIRGGANGDDDEGHTDTEDNSDDEEQNLALPHFWNGQQWVPIPLPPPIPQDQLLQGDEIIEGEGLGLRIARKIYDWYKPPIDFEEWRARQQDRFASDAEVEAALEEAKASRVLREAEAALNKLRSDTAEYKKKLLAIRNEKMRLAREIGVWVGDDRNPIDWESARAETARRQAERERIQREEPDYDVVEGEGLSVKDLNALLNDTYSKGGNVNDYVIDNSISTKTSKVYVNPKTGSVVVGHRGTEGLFDWGNNLVYAFGGKTAYELTPRFKEAKAVQMRAEKKYGAKNISTIGHSQGGLQAEMLGKNSKEIITLNKATRPSLFGDKTAKNQYDVRSSRDIVSALNPFAPKDSKAVEIKGETLNPLEEHNVDVLKRLDEEQQIGVEDEEILGEGLKHMNRVIQHLKDNKGMRRPPLDQGNPDYIAYKHLREKRDMVKRILKGGR